jgi:hypothetical protein
MSIDQTGEGGWVFGKQVGNPTSTRFQLKTRDSKDSASTETEIGFFEFFFKNSNFKFQNQKKNQV